MFRKFEKTYRLNPRIRTSFTLFTRWLSRRCCTVFAIAYSVCITFYLLLFIRLDTCDHSQPQAAAHLTNSVITQPIDLTPFDNNNNVINTPHYSHYKNNNKNNNNKHHYNSDDTSDNLDDDSTSNKHSYYDYLSSNWNMNFLSNNLWELFVENKRKSEYPDPWKVFNSPRRDIIEKYNESDIITMSNPVTFDHLLKYTNYSNNDPNRGNPVVSVYSYMPWNVHYPSKEIHCRLSGLLLVNKIDKD